MMCFAKNNYKKGQTATEYLIILAVVIIIALLVVGTLGGIPTIGGRSGDQVAQAQLQLQDVGITNYKIDSKSTLLFVRNNQPSTITITDITVDGVACAFTATTLRSGQTKELTCYGFKSDEIGEAFQHPITITYIDSLSGASYTMNDTSIALVGDVASGSVLHTGQGTCYDISQSNGYNAIACSNTNAGGEALHDGAPKSFSDEGNNVLLDEHTGLY